MNPYCAIWIAIQESEVSGLVGVFRFTALNNTLVRKNTQKITQINTNPLHEDLVISKNASLLTEENAREWPS